MSIDTRESTQTRGAEGRRVRIEVTGHVAEVVLDRPEKHNALDPAMFAAIGDAVDRIAGEPTVRAVLLRGDGPSFCSGLDFPSFMKEGGSPVDLFVHRDGEAANLAQRVAYGWRALPVPVIVALHGACFGGGCQIALGADVRIAAPVTRLSLMETEFGIIPDMSITQTLAGLVPTIWRAS